MRWMSGLSVVLCKYYYKLQLSFYEDAFEFLKICGVSLVMRSYLKNEIQDLTI